MPSIQQIYDEQFALMYHCHQLYGDIEEMVCWERTKFASLLVDQFKREKEAQEQSQGGEKIRLPMGVNDVHGMTDAEKQASAAQRRHLASMQAHAARAKPRPEQQGTSVVRRSPDGG